MPVLFLKQWVSGEMIRAISWTLLHSLWQGLFAALIAGIIITCTRKSRALLRYNLLGSVLVLFLVTTIITLFVELSDTKTFSSAPLYPGVDKDLIANYNPTNIHATVHVAGYIDQFINYLNNNATLVVLIWLIFFLAKCVKMTAGLLYINKIRSTGIHKPADEWNRKILQLSELLGLRQTIRLFESELVKVPAAIGVLKPLILVPLGLLANLPAEHVETILLHELSHIRRKDFLVNLFQNVAETVFFFNPALIWISSLIREEREACC
ncbi:MAG TPA: M56 family metallopeptidase, partial [Flavitalea sp.]|nr:M56 family metallopeptidase [Flavitalea sp.]